MVYTPSHHRLNAELMASGWNNFFGVIRDNNSIPADMRELLVRPIELLLILCTLR